MINEKTLKALLVKIKKTQESLLHKATFFSWECRLPVGMSKWRENKSHVEVRSQLMALASNGDGEAGCTSYFLRQDDDNNANCPAPKPWWWWWLYVAEFLFINLEYVNSFFAEFFCALTICWEMKVTFSVIRTLKVY